MLKALILFAATAVVLVSSQETSEESSLTLSRSKKPNRCNERWVECPSILCVPATCDDLGKPISCPRIAKGRCPTKPGYVCIEDYVRDKNGVCIPKENCPSCGGDRNAKAGCSLLCERQCNSNGTVIPSRCNKFVKDGICEVNGCECKKGFVYDKIKRKCIRSTECKNLCPKPNEVYDTCPLTCPPRKCGINDLAVLCAANLPCQRPRCRCKSGTYKNPNGDCVAWKDCPKVRSTTEYPTTTEEPIITTVTPNHCPDNLEQLLTEAIANFTGIFLHESVKSQPGENLIMSPFSVFVPMAQLAAFSGGETLKQFLSALNLPFKEYISCVFPPLLKGLTSGKDVILNMAARIFATNTHPLTKNFLDYTSQVFDAVAESLDFTNGEASSKRINEWVANATNDRIKDITTPDQFSGDTRLVLANAIYFLGNWVLPFDEDNTEDRDFHVSKDETVQIPTMYQQARFKYGESSKLNAKILEMFYKGYEYSFVVFLPNEQDGLVKLVEDLQDPNVFYEAYNNTDYGLVQVSIPKMEIESRFNLADIMQKAGIVDVFDPSKSYLTGILETYEPLSITSAQQKAFCKVDEKGTEAAAANVFVGGITSVVEQPEINVMNCDHPYIYYIVHKQKQLFSGVYVKPSPADN